jgi:hypothetical protein
MKDNKYRLFLYKPAAANFVVDSAEYRAEFLGELKVDNLQTNIKLQEISTLSFTLPENILGELNTRIDEVLDSYVVELWYGKLEGNLGADYFPEQGSRIRFIITKSVLNYNDGIKRYSYEADSLEYILEFKHIFNWPGIKVKDYYRTIRYDKQLEKFVEVESTGSSGYTISTSTNTNQTKYITVPTTYGKTANAPSPFEIFLYQYRRNTEDTVNSENSIVEFSRGINDEFFKEGFYVPVLNSEGKVTDLNIALPNNIANFGSSNPNAIFEMFLYDNPLSRKIATVTESTNENNEPAAQVILTAQNVETKFPILANAKNNSNILEVRRFTAGKLQVGQKIIGPGIITGTLITEVNINRINAIVTISNNYTGFNRRLRFEIISENIVYITPPTPPLDPVIEYSFSSQLIYSINGLKLEEALLGTQETRNQLNEIDNSTLNIDGILYDTGFSIGVIHPEIAEKFRSNIELKNITGYEAIKNLAESFDAIVVYETINKTVSFYPDKNEEVFVNNGLIITKQNYLKSITNDINATKVITKAYAAGKDNVGIELINPTGGAAWEDYSYFLDTYYVKFNKNNLLAFTQNAQTGITFTSFPVGTLARWIEAPEASKLAQWQYARDYFHAILLGDLVSSISGYNTRYYDFYKLRDDTLSKFVKEETRYYEFKATEYKYKYIYEYYIKLNKNTPTNQTLQFEIDYKKKYDDAVDASTEALKEINKLHYNLFNTRIDGTIAANGDDDFSELDIIAQNSFASKISEIQSFLDKAKWQINLEKLKVFEKDSVMTDSKIDNQFDLLEALETFVKENCVPVVTLQIDVVDFLASYQSKVDWDKVKIGDIVNIYYPDFNIDTSAQIREISIDFQSNSLQFVISTYRQYSQLPLTYIAKQIRNNYDNNTNKLLYSHDNDSYSNDLVDKINEQVEEKGFEASTTKITFGARALSGETSSEISEDGIISNVIGVDPLLEVFIYSQEKTLSIADGTLTAKNIVKANDVVQFTSEVEVSGDNGFVIRKVLNDANKTVQNQVYIDTDGNAVFAGKLQAGVGQPQTIDEVFDNIGDLIDAGTTIFTAESEEDYNDALEDATNNDVLFITGDFIIGTTEYLKDQIFRYDSDSNTWEPDLDLANKISGSVGGWTIDSNRIAANNNRMILHSDSVDNSGRNPYLSIGQLNNVGFDETGVFLGIDGGTELVEGIAKLSLRGNDNFLKWDGEKLEIDGDIGGTIGSLTVGTISITSNGILGTNDGTTKTFELRSDSGAGFIGGFNFSNENLTATNLTLRGGLVPILSIGQTTIGTDQPGIFLGRYLTDPSTLGNAFAVGDATRFIRFRSGGGALDSVGNFQIETPNFKVNNNGDLTSTSGNIGGFSISNNTLSSTSGGNQVGLSTSFIYSQFQNPLVLWAGGSVSGSFRSFQVDVFGGMSVQSAKVGVLNTVMLNSEPVGVETEVIQTSQDGGYYTEIYPDRIAYANFLGGVTNRVALNNDGLSFYNNIDSKFRITSNFAAGSSNLTLSLTTPSSITANRNITLPDQSGTLLIGYNAQLVRSTAVPISSTNLTSVFLDSGTYRIEVDLIYSKNTNSANFTLGFFINSGLTNSRISGVWTLQATPNAIPNAYFMGTDVNGIPTSGFTGNRNAVITTVTGVGGNGAMTFLGTLYLPAARTLSINILASVANTFNIVGTGNLRIMRV